MEKGLEHLLQKLKEIREANNIIQKANKEIQGANAKIQEAAEKIEKMQIENVLAVKLIDLYYSLLEKGDKRAYEFLDIMVSERASRGFDGFVWGTLEYLETKYPKLYGQIQ